ncbi:MAG: polyprenyl synthetase family protein, partial [Chlamydiia bacterium]|nr:polyprenyl synthetase family protein [Chlamydiia bacterium]
SLIHDDLPCMDNDDFRRGKPSLHKAFPEGVALLTGDFLLTFAFEVLAKAPFLLDNQKLRLIQILSAAAGGLGMIGGQVKDLLALHHTMQEEELLFIHKGKTAALFSASMQFGGVIANCNQEQLELLTKIGNTYGLAYQLQDDLDDETEEKEEPNAVHLLGKDEVKLRLFKMHKTLHHLIEQLPFNTDSLKTILFAHPS